MIMMSNNNTTLQLYTNYSGAIDLKMSVSREHAKRAHLSLVHFKVLTHAYSKLPK